MSSVEWGPRRQSHGGHSCVLRGSFQAGMKTELWLDESGGQEALFPCVRAGLQAG